MQTARYPIKSLLGLGVAAMLSLYGTLDFYGNQTELNRAQPDPYKLAAQETRFEALKRELPPLATVGYVSDLKPDPAIFWGVQYALAPALLVDQPRSDLVVGNFSRLLDYAEFGRARNLILVKDFSNGAVLFRKAK
jgi:hypothetical protein